MNTLPSAEGQPCPHIVHPVAQRLGPTRSNGWMNSQRNVIIAEAPYVEILKILETPKQCFNALAVYFLMTELTQEHITQKLLAAQQNAP